MSVATRYTLCRDYRGMYWDALLYVPTVSALAVFAASSWYDGKVPMAYLLGFLACFFLIAGSNRILDDAPDVAALRAGCHRDPAPRGRPDPEERRYH